MMAKYQKYHELLDLIEKIVTVLGPVFIKFVGGLIVCVMLLVKIMRPDSLSFETMFTICTFLYGAGLLVNKIEPK
jgi:hypothetical protein